MIKWKDKIQVQKGDIGEYIIKNLLEKKGYILYAPETEGKHCFDKIAVKDKKEMFIVEIKTKARLNNYNATGFNKRNYEEYKYIYNKYKVRIFIFFVDEMLEEVYGNFLDILDKNKQEKNWQGGIVLFRMEDMVRNLYKLTDKDIKLLKNKSTRNYEYNNDNLKLFDME